VPLSHIYQTGSVGEGPGSDLLDSESKKHHKKTILHPNECFPHGNATRNRAGHGPLLLVVSTAMGQLCDTQHPGFLFSSNRSGEDLSPWS
jgi:hypothetical protein